MPGAGRGGLVPAGDWHASLAICFHPGRIPFAAASLRQRFLPRASPPRPRSLRLASAAGPDVAICGDRQARSGSADVSLELVVLPGAVARTRPVRRQVDLSHPRQPALFPWLQRPPAPVAGNAAGPPGVSAGILLPALSPGPCSRILAQLPCIVGPVPGRPRVLASAAGTRGRRPQTPFAAEATRSHSPPAAEWIAPAL